MTHPTRSRAIDIGAFLLATFGATALLVAAGLAEAQVPPTDAPSCSTCLSQEAAR